MERRRKEKEERGIKGEEGRRIGRRKEGRKKEKKRKKKRERKKRKIICWQQ